MAMDVPIADAISSLRRYVLDYAVGILWLIGLALVCNPATVLNTLAQVRLGIKIPPQATVLLLTAIAIVLPYICGVVGNTFSSVLLMKLQRRRAGPSAELKREIRATLREATGVEVPDSDVGLVVGAFVGDQRDPIVAYVRSQVDHARFRLMLSLPLFVALLAASCRADLALLPKIAVAAAVVVAAVFFGYVEIRMADPQWKYFYYGALMLRKRREIDEAAESTPSSTTGG